MPVKLIGEGEYNLDDLKEIKVTEDFLGLPEFVRGCKNGEPVENCETEQYIGTMIKECHCVPFYLRLADEAASICSSSKEEQCVKNLKPDISNCSPPCSGLMVTSFSKSSNTKKIEDIFSAEEISAYNKYTNRTTLISSGEKGF